MAIRSNLPTATGRLLDATLRERERCIAIIERRAREIGGAIQPDRTIRAILDDTKAKGI